jgi:hypothetical protein
MSAPENDISLVGFVDALCHSITIVAASNFDHEGHCTH